jgi:hypothetical protein
MYLIWCGEIEKFSLLTMTSLSNGPIGRLAPIRNETRHDIGGIQFYITFWGFGPISLCSRVLSLA